jgi:hypothetical protein
VPEGEAIARLMLENLKRAVGETVLYRETSARITTHTDKPVVCLMLGMLSHPEVERSIADGTRIPLVAGAIAEAVAQHYTALVR